MLSRISPAHLLVVLAVVLLLFGGKRLPDAARGLGRSMRIFKSEIKQMQAEDTTPGAPTTPVEGRVIDTPTGTPADTTQTTQSAKPAAGSSD